MKLYDEDVRRAAARDAARAPAFPALTGAQLERVRGRARELHAWYRAHPRTHNAISALVLTVIFGADWLVLILAPRALAGALDTAAGAALAGALAGIVHGGSRAGS